MNTFLIFFYNINMKNIYKTIFMIYIITLIFSLFDSFHFSFIISLILLAPLLFIQSYLYRSEYMLYVYFTQVLGTTCGFYNLPYYDKTMHFLSGALFVIIAYIILKPMMNQKTLLYIMMNCVETAVAFLWEVFEYSGLILFNYDASRHYTTGVHDTMQDMIFSFLAGLLMTWLIYKFPSCIDNLYKSQPDSLAQVSQQSHT